MSQHAGPVHRRGLGERNGGGGGGMRGGRRQPRPGKDGGAVLACVLAPLRSMREKWAGGAGSCPRMCIHAPADDVASSAGLIPCAWAEEGLRMSASHL